MSDTLQEEEDRMSEHQVNRSGVCEIPGCPCRGWSAQETAGVKEVKGNDECAFIHKLVSGNVRCGALRQHHSQYTGHEFTEPSHQPATRGGGERGCRYPERHQTATYIPCQDCDYRDNPALLSIDKSIKPLAWMRRWAFEGRIPEKVKNAKGRWVWPREAMFHDVTKAKVCADDIPLYVSNQHQALVAEREQMVEALKGVAIMLNTELERYDKEPWAQRVRAAITFNEQRSTSE